MGPWLNNPAVTMRALIPSAMADAMVVPELSIFN